MLTALETTFIESEARKEPFIVCGYGHDHATRYPWVNTATQGLCGESAVKIWNGALISNDRTTTFQA